MIWIRRHLATALAALAIAVAAGLAWHGMRAVAPAPTVTYTLLDGRQTNLQALRGKVVLVNFWATSCTACVHEMPSIVDTYLRFKARGYDTVAVAMSYDAPASVADFAESRKLPFGVVIDNTGSVARSFGDVRLTPTSYLINQRGEIVKRYVGAPDFVALQELIEQMLVAG